MISRHINGVKTSALSFITSLLQLHFSYLIQELEQQCATNALEIEMPIACVWGPEFEQAVAFPHPQP